jgi:phage FluMu protein Com
MIKNYQKSIANSKKNDMIYLKYQCPHCGKLLFKYLEKTTIYGIQIKCGRCKKIVDVK